MSDIIPELHPSKRHWIDDTAISVGVALIVVTLCKVWVPVHDQNLYWLLAGMSFMLTIGTIRKDNWKTRN